MKKILAAFVVAGTLLTSGCVPFLSQLPSVAPSLPGGATLQPGATPTPAPVEIVPLTGVTLVGTGEYGENAPVRFTAANQAEYRYKVLEEKPEKAPETLDDSWLPAQSGADLANTGGRNIALAVLGAGGKVTRFAYYAYVPGYVYYPAEGAEGAFSPAALSMLAAVAGKPMNMKTEGKPEGVLFAPFAEGTPYAGNYAAGLSFYYGFAQPVYAPAAGKVSGVGANYVALYLEGQGVTLVLSGLLAPGVEAGAEVSVGTRLGVAGANGTADGLVRLHIEAQAGEKDRPFYAVGDKQALLANFYDPRALLQSASFAAPSPYELWGNTPGNMNNKAMAFYMEGFYYFANDKDAGRLYKMDAATGERTRLSKDKAAFITGDGEWIYYSNLSSNSRLFRIKPNGEGRERIANVFADYLTVRGDWIYFRNYTRGSHLYRVRKDGTGIEAVYKRMAWSYVPLEDGLYYIDGAQKERIYRLTITRPEATEETPNPELQIEQLKITDNGAAYLETDGQYLYYTHKADNNKIYKFNPATGEHARILQESAEMLVHYNGRLYFVASADNQRIYSIDLNGGDKQLVTERAYCTDVAVTGNRLFFRQANAEQPQYYIDLSTGEEVRIDS